MTIKRKMDDNKRSGFEEIVCEGGIQWDEESTDDLFANDAGE